MNHSTTADFQQSANAELVDVYDGEALLGTAIVNGGNWTFAASNLSLGLHSFTAHSSRGSSAQWRITVAEEAMNLVAPHVREASTVGNNSERLDYYQVNDDIHCLVPDYHMKSGDAVTVHWVGRNVTIDSPTQTVESTPMLQPFPISKYEVIDVIGQNASIYYTVRRPTSTQTFTSLPLLFTVDGHAFQLDAPSINGAHDNLRVQKQTQFNKNSTAGVRAIGPEGDEWSVDVTPCFGSDTYLNFSIDPSWLARNRGKPAIFNCSVMLNPGDAHYLFSQLLRVPSV